jgi:hypothetical protein
MRRMCLEDHLAVLRQQADLAKSKKEAERRDRMEGVSPEFFSNFGKYPR